MQASSLILQFLLCQLTRLAQRHDPGDIEGAAAQTVLMPAAILQRRNSNAIANKQRADPFGGVHLVPGDGEQINVHPVDLERDLARSLGSVGVEERAAIVPMITAERA